MFQEVLITGGAGFVGSHLVEELFGKCEKITVIDDFSNGRKENIEHVEGINLIQKDISNSDWSDLNSIKGIIRNIIRW